jgi:cytochrome c
MRLDGRQPAVGTITSAAAIVAPAHARSGAGAQALMACRARRTLNRGDRNGAGPNLHGLIACLKAETAK